MDINDEEIARIFAQMQGERLRSVGVQRLRDARQLGVEILGQIDGVRVAPGGVMAAVDGRFALTRTFQPSTMIRTQLRLAVHYVQAADEGGFPGGKSQHPSLSSFVVLRAAIECTASAHWLLSGKNHRESVERVLKRMWWDTTSAAEMATTADNEADGTGLSELTKRISEIARPIKGLASETIVESKRMPLSMIVADAGAALHPEYPTMMRAGWMLCSGIAHGNLPVSAGAGVTAASIQQPSQHLIDNGSYGHIFAAIVGDIHATVQLFERRAAEQHEHQQPGATYTRVTTRVD